MTVDHKLSYAGNIEICKIRVLGMEMLMFDSSKFSHDFPVGIMLLHGGSTVLYRLGMFPWI